jgi:hypothetical protein
VLKAGVTMVGKVRPEGSGMRIRRLGRAFQSVGFGLVALLIAASAARAAGDGDAARGLRTEAQATQVENLIGELLGSNLAASQ